MNLLFTVGFMLALLL
jgi:hypothetical protein